MKTIALIIPMLFFFAISCKAQSQTNLYDAQEITGVWNWQNDNGKHITEIKLNFVDSNENELQGNYCSVFFNGSKVDCEELESSYCINLSRTEDNTYEGTFQSFSHGGTGTLRIIYDAINDSITLDVLTSEGVFYLPQHTTFNR
ncbi:DUF6705 family protein [Mangrovimonas spongiae]|uniref:Lipocalin-like domain-containing protein n=1 Tax=Mangrovimonas spongiae TaxID=2494697 RepID=A0A3R9P0T4_9FLAO|nr:DUF6705 family protein [Mangrovimonas spongiae]RSK41779.1 hypothetical protein EJA19_02550 [Mangrovimonas spongiae]